ncbi:MAG: type II toxin-antitoxin system prevent-host-death family antitoxin [Chloroflexi bacterium]|nr:type II toxin-antitoxin system prevent-host-death family antitoxin [Chloroflexota bacterium]
MNRIGLRELRQNASAYVKRAERGEIIEVTLRGRPVARLMPRGSSSVRDRLIEEGRLRPGGGQLLETLASLGPPLAPKRGVPLPSTMLEAMREERLG